MVVTNVLGQPQVVELGATTGSGLHLRLPPRSPCSGPAAHLRLPCELIGLDEDGADAYILAHGPQRWLHGLPRPQDGHAGDLGAGLNCPDPASPAAPPLPRPAPTCFPA